MRVFVGLIACFLLLQVLGQTPARACEVGFSAKVVGFSADGGTVILREAWDMGEDDVTKLQLRLVSLADGTTAATHLICADREQCLPQVKPSARARNWSRIEKELTGQGFAFSKEPAATTELKDPAVKLELRRAKSPGGIAPRDLVAVQGKKVTVLLAKACPGSSTVMDPAGCQGPYVDPKQRFVFAVGEGCGSSSLKALALDEVKAKLR
ncbi:MAG: hypothetical protein ABIJ09_26545 [Pseudomonadota bacterium]